jgi:hypothetical protein
MRVAMSMARFTCFCAVVLALGVAVACSDDTSPSTPEELPDEVIKAVGEKGGTLKANGMTLEIPAGALSKEIKISVMNTGRNAPKEARAEQLSDVYEFGPPGTKFDKDVKVTFQAKTDDPKAGVYFTKEDGSGFEKIESEKAGEQFTARVKHFSQGFVGVPLDEDSGADASAQDAGGPDELDVGSPDLDTGAEDAAEPTDTEPELDADLADAGDDAASETDAGPADGGTTAADAQEPLTDAAADAPAEAGPPPTTHIVVHSRTRAGLLVNQTWAAFQDGQGAWQALPAPGAAGIYEFDVAGAVYGVAFVCSQPNFANSWNSITYAPITSTSLDVYTEGPPCIGTPTPKYTVGGSLVTGTDQGWRVGHAHQGGPAINFGSNPSYLVGDIYHNEPNDLLFASSTSSALGPISRLLIHRDLTVTANTTGVNLDLVKGGLTPLNTATAQVLNANDATNVDVYYTTRGTGIGLWINTSATTGSAARTATFATLRETMRRPTDRYVLMASDDGGTQWRLARVATYASGNLSVSLPPVFAPGFSSLSAPYLRPVIGFAQVAGASAYVIDVSYSPVRSSNHRFTLDVQPGWLGAASASIAFPDFSQVPGFDARWVGNDGGVAVKAAVLTMSSSGGSDFKSESGQSATVTVP